MYGIKKLLEILKGNILSVVVENHEEDVTKPNLVRTIQRLLYTGAIPKLLLKRKVLLDLRPSGFLDVAQRRCIYTRD